MASIPISVIFRRYNGPMIVPGKNNHGRRNGPTGYSLFEVMAVLLLMAILAGVAVPRLTTMHRAVRWAHERDEAIRCIERLGFTAFQESRRLVLKAYPPEDSADFPLKLPAGWIMEADPPVIYNAKGVCLGGQLQLKHEDRVVSFKVKPPLGKLEAVKR